MIKNLASFTGTATGADKVIQSDLGRYGTVSKSNGTAVADVIEIYGKVRASDTGILLDTLNNTKPASVVALLPIMYAKCTTYVSAVNVDLTY